MGTGDLAMSEKHIPSDLGCVAGLSFFFSLFWMLFFYLYNLAFEYKVVLQI